RAQPASRIRPMPRYVDARGRLPRRARREWSSMGMAIRYSSGHDRGIPWSSNGKTPPEVLASPRRSATPELPRSGAVHTAPVPATSRRAGSQRRGQRVAGDAYGTEGRPLEPDPVRRLRAEHLAVATDEPAEAVARGRRAAEDELADRQERVVEERVRFGRY